MIGEPVAAGSMFERPDAMDPRSDSCDKCGAFDGQRRPGGRYRVIRFGLEFRPKGKSGRGRLCRSIRLCDHCWKGLRA